MKKTKLSFQVIVFTLIRVIINSVYRLVYPLEAELIRGLGVSFTQFSRAITLRSLAGGLGPFIASVTNRRGRRFGMLFGMALVIFGLAIVVFWPSYLTFMVSMFFAIWGKYVFDPAIQAYLGDRISYEKRGRYLAITEFGWSGATLVGIPFAGFLIARGGWVAPFPLFLIMMMVLFVVLFFVIPKDTPVAGTQTRLIKQLRVIFSSVPAIAGLMVTLIISASNESINLVFSVWLKQSFGLSIAALGASSVVLGVAELIGEGGVTVLVDRMGKTRAVFFGVLTTSAAMLLLPVLGTSWQGAFFGLFLVYLAFEFTYVSSIPLMTEVLPQTRATFMAVSIAAASIGRALGAFVIPAIFALGILPTAIFAASINLFALIALRFVRLPNDESTG